ncbi:MAG: hypothetical protein ACXVBE_16505, partial [Bdellovibrionota bacterium]
HLTAQYEEIVKDESRFAEMLEVVHEIEKLQNQRAAREMGLPVTPMLRKFWGEQWGHMEQMKGKNVRYFTPEERSQLEVQVEKDGLLHRADGSLVNNCKRGTENYVCDPGIFVMDAEGRFYFYDGPLKRKQEGAIHHSSFFAGLPVSAAGELEVINGKIIRMSGSSGHYKPKKHYLIRAALELKHQGAQSLGKLQMEGLWGLP